MYRAIGGAAGCHALATAFYAHVERDPVLRPLFPSTFKCAIEAFSAFLVQFLGGEAEAMQRRWWLSLRESHSHLAIGSREREAWMRAMTATLAEESAIGDARVRGELLQFFEHSSAHVVNKGSVAVVEPIAGELAGLWEEQLALDEAVALLRLPDEGGRLMDLVESEALRGRFARSPGVHAKFLAIAANTGVLREWAIADVRRKPSLVHERYGGGRTMLHDAAGAGDVALVELLLDLGAGETDVVERALYCVGNECHGPGGSEVVRVLAGRSAARVNAVHGVKRCTALHMAARRGNVEVIGALLDAGADPEARDSMGETPLRRAVNCDRVAAAELLLERGANAGSVGKKGMTPRLAARSRGMRDVFSTRGWV